MAVCDLYVLIKLLTINTHEIEMVVPGADTASILETSRYMSYERCLVAPVNSILPSLSVVLL